MDLDQNQKNVQKARKGFSVGPANLPDGTHRRKVLKIKHDLIRKAKVKKSYKKLKQQEQLDSLDALSRHESHQRNKSPAFELHPERQAMLDKPQVMQSGQEQEIHRPRQRRLPRPKAAPFQKEAQLAQRRKEEREKRQEEIKQANLKRQAKVEERERFRKIMAKARSGGKDGKRKLGLESKVLLEKVQRIMTE